MDATTQRVERTGQVETPPEGLGDAQRAKLIAGLAAMRPSEHELAVACEVAKKLREIGELIVGMRARMVELAGGPPLDAGKCLRMGLYAAAFTARDDHRDDVRRAIESLATDRVPRPATPETAETLA